MFYTAASCFLCTFPPVHLNLVCLALSTALARPFLSHRLSFLFSFKSCPSAARHYLYVISPFFPLCLLSLVVSSHPNLPHFIAYLFPSIRLPLFSFHQSSLTLIFLIFLPLSLPFLFPSPPFFNRLNSFLILTIDPHLISNGCLANVLVFGFVLAV